MTDGTSGTKPRATSAGPRSGSASRTGTGTGTGTGPGVRAAAGARWLGPLAWVIALAVLLAPLSTFGTLGEAGLWDPPELETAELARRIGVNILGADGLVVPERDNSVPIASELGRGQLPLTVLAGAFAGLGLEPWAGRLVFGLWGLLALLATWIVARRLADRTVAALAVLVLATTPLFFVQSRTLLGDVVTMAGSALAVAGLGLATFDSRLGRLGRGLALVVGLLGLAVGFGARGLLVGLAIPASGVGVAWLVATSAGLRESPGALVRAAQWAGGALVSARVIVWTISAIETRSGAGSWLTVAVVVSWVALCALAPSQASARRTFSDAIGAFSLMLASSAAWVSGAVLSGAGSGSGLGDSTFTLVMGAAFLDGNRFPTFDVEFQALAHGLIPWAAVLPFAVGRMLRSPEASECAHLATRERRASRDDASAFRLVVLSTLVTGFVAYAVMASAVALPPFAPVFAVALCVAWMLRDIDFGAPTSLALGAGIAALGVVLFSDFRHFPEKAFAAYGLPDEEFPEALVASSTLLVALAVVLPAFILVLILMERRNGPAFASAPYRAWFAGLWGGFNGRLGWSLILIEAGLVFAGIGGLGLYVGWWRFGAGIPVPIRTALLNAWWVLPVALVLIPVAGVAARDAVRTFFRVVPVGRGVAACLCLALGGLVLSFAYFPALAAQLSPKDAFDAFEERRGAGDELGVLGLSPATASYHVEVPIAALEDPESAVAWLLDDSSRPRWVVMDSKLLARANSLFRVQRSTNLPVAYVSDRVLLAKTSLPAEEQKNPLQLFVLDAPPELQHPIDAELEGWLDVLGWEVSDSSHAVVDTLLAGTRYDLTICYRVKKQFAGTWRTFVHLEGAGAERLQLDHDTLGDLYPMEEWREGDMICDKHAFTVPPYSAPADRQLYFGLYRGNRRLKVTRGDHDDDRIRGGVVKIR